ncbi:hypothetical protein [Streptomyces boninensis]|uniref:hypothetical protein n=1 Tax=Streptomyces boninensis TaxID=2039455 RepID=UPI003B227072
MVGVRPGARSAAGIAGAAALLFSLLLPTAWAAPALDPDSSNAAAASSASGWLAKQLDDDGTLQNPLGGALPDHGLMIDVLFALHASGDGAAAEPIADYLDQGKHASDYFTWDGLVPDQGYDAIITGGAAAKTLVAAEVAGRDPRRFGGYDMVAETKSAIMRSGPDKGRVSDYSKNPDFADFVSNNANMFGQALAVIGLAGVRENDRPAIDTLLSQQCSEGYFRVFFGYIPTDETGDHVTPNGQKVSTCDEGKEYGQSAPDGDTTGLALSALLAARKAGAGGLDGAIDRTVDWLKQHQTSGGGWGGGVSTEAPNTNSTGLIVQALAEAGGAGQAVEKGADYLASAQVTAAADGGNSLAGEIGAIAYTPADYQAARSGGIVGLDTWIRAGAQASLGLAQTGFYDLTQGETPPGGGEEPPPGGGGQEPPPGGSGGPKDPPRHGGSGGIAGGSPGSATAPGSVPDTDGDPDTGRPAPPPGSTGGAVVQPATANAEPAPDTPAGRLGRYLAGRLVDGDHVEVTQDGHKFVDYDQTADLVLALHVLDAQPQAVARATRFLLAQDSVRAYAHGVPYEKGPAAYAEPLGKLRVIAGFRTAAAGAPAGVAAERLDAELAALRTGGGWFTDKGEHGDGSGSATRHVWATVATIADPKDGRAAKAALSTLIKHQCKDGTFPKALLPGADDCRTGDLAATAAAAVALNAQPAVPAKGDAKPKGAVPDGWAPGRIDALNAAATALQRKVGADGLVRSRGDAPDAVLSALVAGGRQAAGLDATVTARALGKLLRADGGMAAPSGSAPPGSKGSDPKTSSDPRTSIAVAPGVAGASWMSAPGSPVAPAVSLPAAGLGPGAAGKAHDGADGGLPVWAVAALSGGGVLLALAAFLALRRFVRKTNGRKAVTA